MFLLANPAEAQEQTDPQLITYAMIKPKNTGLYTKALERWNVRAITDRKRWSDFCMFMIEQYERMLREGTGPTAAQEG